MRILSLTLENFQGVRSASFQFDGMSGSIYGDNATGKTTVFNAATWLLFGQASTGAKGFTPKTDGPEGELHHLDHAAEMRIALDSGRIVTLRKVFHEVWKKKRGNADADFSGHTVDYFMDGVPVKEKEYTAALLDFCGGDERMKLLTMPDYFPEVLSWDRRRQLLLEVCGDVTDGDIIAENPELAELPDYLRMPGTENQYYTVDQYRKSAADRQGKINKELDQIPGLIAEAERAIPEIAAGVSAGTVRANIAALESRIARLNEEKAAAAGTTAGAEVRGAIANLRSQIAEGRAKYTEEQNARLAAWRKEYNDADGEAQSRRWAKENADAELALASDKRKRMAETRERMVAEFNEAAAIKWSDENAVCPTCGQPFPADRAEQMKADFNQRRSDRLMEIRSRGQTECSKEMIAACDAEIARLSELSKTEEAKMKEASDRAAALLREKPSMALYENTADYQALYRQIEAFEKRTGNQDQAVRDAVAAVDAQIADANAALKAEQEKRANLATAEAQRARIAELEARQKELSRTYEETEKGLHLCGLFIKSKVRMLTDRINGHFRSVRFRLFVDQVNGGVKDDCEVLVPSADGSLVPYRDANNAARINAGLEIIEALSNHWDTFMPVFIDNAEGVQFLNEIETQVIQLVVPISWEKLGNFMRGILTEKYGSEETAKQAYERPNKKLRLELESAA